MKLKIFKKWHQNPDLAHVLFFAQRLDELYFDYTLDTYKPPALISTYLCREAITLIHEIENEVIDRNNLNPVLEELEWSIRNDEIAKRILNAPVEKFILRGEDSKLIDTRVRLEVLERTLNPHSYLFECQSAIKQAISEKSKKKINQLARHYASALINHGISKQSLYEKTIDFFFYGNEITNQEEIEKYFELVSPTVHEYEIYFLVSKLIIEVKDSIPDFNIKITEELNDSAAEAAKAANLVPTESEVWVEIEDIKGFDRYSAKREAESRLDMIRDLFLLFSHKNRINWRPEAVVSQCCEEKTVIVKKQKNSMEKCFDLRAQDASTRLNSLIKNIGLKNSSFKKFNRAVDLHGIGSTNDLPENQLINIWIALETLVPSHINGGSKISKICNAMLPILLRKYHQRILRRATADLIRWSRSKTSKILRKIKNQENLDLYEKVLSLLALEENKELRSELYAELGDFHLLRLRLFELSELFSNPKNLISRIEIHEKKVSWQIRRIYRTRNLIVHSGKSPKYLDTLIENAHDYLDQTLDSIIEYSCGYLDAKTLEQVFDMAKVDWDVYISNMREISEINSSNFTEVL